MSKIEIFAEEDRLAVAAILIKNGYTVRQLRERTEGKRSYKYYIDYTKPRTTTKKDEKDEEE